MPVPKIKIVTGYILLVNGNPSAVPFNIGKSNSVYMFVPIYKVEPFFGDAQKYIARIESKSDGSVGFIYLASRFEVQGIYS